ncbi:TIGR03773 family transporter-associated surface protein [Streptomyces tritici]|uniref:TIGR03773 family transporter-associated surface protein n=1 Tax=Streptomyces tritici TaxID=2054410 RepID=UPI003AEF2A38
MRLIGNSRIALAAAGALALGGTAMTVPPPDGAPGATAPVVARVTLTDGALSLGTSGVVDVDDTHRVTGADGTDRWEFEPVWDTTGTPADAAGLVRWSLTALEGPGTLRVSDTTGVEGEEPAVRFDSADGLPDGHALPTGASGVTRWSFDAPGTYAVTFTAETEVDGRPLRTEVRHTVRVGDAAVAAPAEPAGPTAPTTPAPPAPSPPGRPEAPAAPAAGPLGLPEARRVARPLAAEPVETARTVLDDGHVDIAARVVDGRLQIHVKDGTVPGRTVWREPSSVVLHVKPQARKAIPANKDFAFLGRAGDPIWLLDQVQQPGLLWPGWSTDNMAAGATNSEVEFTLAKADGPGNFALYNYDGLSGATVRFNSADGVPDAFGVPQNTHAHGGWAFGKEGVYRLTFTMSATLADGSRASDTETLAFSVGAGDPNKVRPGGATGGSTGGSTQGTTGGSDGGSSDGGSSDGGSSTGSDSGGTTGGTGDGSGTGGTMASTGSEGTLLLAGTAVALAAAGAGAVALTRRRTA